MVTYGGDVVGVVVVVAAALAALADIAAAAVGVVAAVALSFMFASQTGTLTVDQRQCPHFEQGVTPRAAASAAVTSRTCLRGGARKPQL